MKSSTKKVLVAMIILLVILIGIIVYLYLSDSRLVPEQQLGQTVIAEQAAEQAAEQETPTPEDTQPAVEVPTEPAVVDLPNEKEVRFYIIDFANHTGELISRYDSTWDPAYDINTFEAINSDQQTITYDDYFALHESFWNAVDTQVKYKIGYEISFDVNGEHKVITILKPDDIANNADLFMGDAENDEVTGYLGVWVYNDIGQSGMYVHLTQADMTEDTLMTSIKLRPTPNSDQISNLKLKTFSYSSDEEFNSAGQYIGTHGYEIPVNKQ